jgi:hypothetical protein
MPYLPSLLEYNQKNLNSKLELIKNNLSDFLIFQQSNDNKIYLHLDFVLRDFAASRFVEPSNFIPELFAVLERYFDSQEVYLSIHLMGLERDIDFSLSFLSRILSRYLLEKPKWSGVIFVPLEFKETFDSIMEVCNFEVGIWFDANEWSLQSSFTKSTQYLLMTVLAGKSGQILDSQKKLEAYTVARQNKKSKFTFDGGWNVDDQLRKNIQIVSYSKFWQEFDKIAKVK